MESHCESNLDITTITSDVIHKDLIGDKDRNESDKQTEEHTTEKLKRVNEKNIPVHGDDHQSVYRSTRNRRPPARYRY